MIKSQLLTCTAIAAVSLVAACGSNDGDGNEDAISGLDPNMELIADDDTGDRDTRVIAGLWDGSTVLGDSTDVVYWSLAENGLLSRFDLQQDGIESANGENCYVIDEPILVTPIEGDVFSLSGVSVRAVVNEDILTITFIEPDVNDLDANGDSTETPTLTWTSITSVTIEGLNSCTVSEPVFSENSPTEGEPSIGGDEPTPLIVSELDSEDDSDSEISMPIDLLPSDNLADRPTLSSAECSAAGGQEFADAGDGFIFTPAYRCDSGMEPIGNVFTPFNENGPNPVEPGTVCCL